MTEISHFERRKMLGTLAVSAVGAAIAFPSSVVAAEVEARLEPERQS